MFFGFRQMQDQVTGSLSLTLILIFKTFDLRVHASCWLSVSHADLLEVKTGARAEPLNWADHLPDQNEESWLTLLHCYWFSRSLTMSESRWFAWSEDRRQTRATQLSGSSAGSENLPGVLTQRSGSNNIKLIYLTISWLSPTSNFGKVL